MQRIINCDKCQKKFIQKWVNRERNWSQLNQVSFWTSGKKWKNYEFFCRSCVKKWFYLEKNEFNNLVDNDKRKLFYSYNGHGAFDRTDYLDN